MWITNFLQHYICTYDPSVFYYGATLAETDALGNTQVADTYDRSLNTDNFVAGFGIAKYNSAGITGKYDTKLTDYFSKDDSALHTVRIFSKLTYFKFFWYFSLVIYKHFVCDIKVKWYQNNTRLLIILRITPS